MGLHQDRGRGGFRCTRGIALLSAIRPCSGMAVRRGATRRHRCGSFPAMPIVLRRRGAADPSWCRSSDRTITRPLLPTDGGRINLTLRRVTRPGRLKRPQEPLARRSATRRGEIGEDAVGARALEGDQAFIMARSPVEPAIGCRRLDHRVFAGGPDRRKWERRTRASRHG